MGFQNKGKNLVDIELANRFSKKTTFLDKVDKLIKWGPINKLLKEKYKKKVSAVGQPAYHPLTMFKILLLEVWYGLSDVAVEEALYDRISFMKFVNLSVTDSVPDHSTISRFRTTLNKLNLYDRLFLLINEQLEKQGLLVKQGVVVDASVIKSATRPRKVIRVQVKDREEPDIANKCDNECEAENGSPSPDTSSNSKEKNIQSSKDKDKSLKEEFSIEYSVDSDAKWIVKGKKAIYGYKSHISVDATNGFILGGHITPANVSDMNQLEAILDESALPTDIPVFADKGYSSNKNKRLIEEKGYLDFIMRKKPKNKDLTKVAKSFNKFISKCRYKVEQAFGTLKRRYNFTRMRYIGLDKCNADFKLKAICFNISKAVRMVN